MSANYIYEIGYLMVFKVVNTRVFFLSEDTKVCLHEYCRIILWWHSPKALAQIGGSGEEKDQNEHTNDRRG
jgi:hypothetical protein